MKTHLKLGALCAAFALGATAVQAFDVLHVANADSADYSAFITAKSGTWTHVASGLTAAGTVGGDLDRLTNFPVNGTHGGTGISVRSYLESFDLVILGNNVTSGNFVDGVNGADWAALTKPVLFHSSLVARSTGGRPGMLTGNNGDIAFVYGNPADSVVVSSSALGTAIFNGVTTPTDLYNNVAAASTETITSVGTFGGGELISSLTDGVTATPPRGIVYWNAGVTNGFGLTLAAKRAFMPLKNIGNSSNTLTADGKIVLGNLIDQLLISSAPVFLPPTGLVAKSGIESINLSWTATTGATSYNVKRSTTSGSGYVTISTAGALTGTTYTDTGLTNGTPYYYVVSGVNAASAESPNSAQATAVPVPTIFPGIDILYISNANSAAYETLAANGQFAANTWTQKATGTSGETIGGSLDRVATFTGVNGGVDLSLRNYMESFDLIIIGVPTTSLNFVDGINGADWASITKPIIVHPNTVARAASGRIGLFSQDNFLTFTHGTPADSAQVSSTALSAALFAGVVTPTDLYASLTNDVIIGSALFGNGEQITRATNGVASHFGIVFWATGDVVGGGATVAANRAFFPIKDSVNDLNTDGKQVLANLINQIQLAQTTAANPYAEWAAATISSVDLLAAPGFDQDGDNDGIRNGLEWMLGGDPLTQDLETVLPVSTGNAASGLTLVFNRATDPIAGSVLTVEWSTDLAAFPHSIAIGTSDVGPSGSNPTVDIDAPSVGKVTVNIPAANAAGGRIFARVKGQSNP